MEFIVSAMHKGGLFMWPILLLFLVGLVVPVGLGLMSLKGKRIPAVLWVLVPGVVLLTGLLGTLQGLDQATQAVAHASDAARSTMAHAGMSVALYTQLTGATVAAVLLVLAGWAAGLSGLRGGEGAKASVLSAGAVAAVVVLGGLGCLGLSLTNHSGGLLTTLLGVLLVPCGLSVAVASLYSGGGEENHARLAELRLAASLCLLFSVGAMGIAATTHAQIMMHEAYSFASPETLMTLMAISIGMNELGNTVRLVAMGVAIVAVLAAVIPLIGGLRNLGAAVSLGGVLLGVVCWGGLAVTVDAATADLSSKTAEVKLAGLSQAVPNLPVDEGRFSSEFQQIWVRDSETFRTYVNGEVQQPISVPVQDGSVLLAMPADTPASVVSKTVWKAEPQDLKLLSRAYENHSAVGQSGFEALEVRQLGMVPITWMPDSQLIPQDKLVVLAEQSDGVMVHYVGSGEPKQVLSKKGVVNELLFGSPVTSALLVPKDNWTVQDLVLLCSLAQRRKVACVITPDSVSVQAAPAVKTAGQVSIAGSPIIMGALDKSGIDGVFRKNMSQLRLCYDRALRAKPGVSGTITVKMVVARDGSVSKVKTKKTTMNNASLESCLNRQVERFKFARPKGGGIAIVSYPLLFSSR